MPPKIAEAAKHVEATFADASEVTSSARIMLFRKGVWCGIAVLCILAGCSSRSKNEPEASNQQGDEPEASNWQSGEIEIPPGVKYSEASVEDNSKAFDFLQSLVDEVRPAEELRKKSPKTIICGPGLWNALKDTAPKELQDAMPATFVIPNLTTGEVQSLDGRVFKTDAQQEEFWDLFQLYLDAFRLLPEFKPKFPIHVRKANANELQYYWSIIPYESIEEPFFVIAIDDTSILFDFIEEDGEQKVFTVDIVLGIDEE